MFMSGAGTQRDTPHGDRDRQRKKTEKEDRESERERDKTKEKRREDKFFVFFFEFFDCLFFVRFLIFQIQISSRPELFLKQIQIWASLELFFITDTDFDFSMVAFGNLEPEMCKAEVTREDAVKGDKRVERAVMLIRGIIRTIKCHNESSTQEPLSDESFLLLWLVEHAGCILSRCQKGRGGKTPDERLHGKKPTQEFVPFGVKVLAKQISN